jgi:hypothetical protein
MNPKTAAIIIATILTLGLLSANAQAKKPSQKPKQDIRDTSIVISIQDYRQINYWLTQPLNEAERSAIIKFWLPQLNTRVKLKIDSIKKVVGDRK